MEELKCPNCGVKLDYVDKIFKNLVYDRYIIDADKKTLTLDYGDIIESDLLYYQCRECETTLPKKLVKILEEEFEED